MFWKTVWRWRCKAGFLNKLSGKTWSPFIFCLIISNFEVPCLSRGAKILTITRRESFHLKEPEQQQPLFARFKLLEMKYSSLNCNVTGALSVEGFSFVFLQTRSLLTCYTTPFFFPPLQVNPIQEGLCHQLQPEVIECFDALVIQVTQTFITCPYCSSEHARRGVPRIIYFENNNLHGKRCLWFQLRASSLFWSSDRHIRFWTRIQHAGLRSFFCASSERESALSNMPFAGATCRTSFCLRSQVLRLVFERCTQQSKV